MNNVMVAREGNSFLAAITLSIFWHECCYMQFTYHPCVHKRMPIHQYHYNIYMKQVAIEKRIASLPIHQSNIRIHMDMKDITEDDIKVGTIINMDRAVRVEYGDCSIVAVIGDTVRLVRPYAIAMSGNVGCESFSATKESIKKNFHLIKRA